MTDKVISKGYRFDGVDFEPEYRQLRWHDKAITKLSFEEARILEALCYNAGEVLSADALFRAAALPDTNILQHQRNLDRLQIKSYHLGQKQLPLEQLTPYGYRIALPRQTYQYYLHPHESDDDNLSDRLSPAEITDDNDLSNIHPTSKLTYTISYVVAAILLILSTIAFSFGVLL